MEEPPQKRFKVSRVDKGITADSDVQYASYTSQINNISVDVGKTKGLAWENEQLSGEIEDSVSTIACVSVHQQD
jgi:hypothetical protein